MQHHMSTCHILPSTLGISSTASLARYYAVCALILVLSHRWVLASGSLTYTCCSTPFQSQPQPRVLACPARVVY
ncbi:hypothetical protein F4815DRAFT_462911 [Daldinia loculata]|uniref:uncharacterized protein n=1 Tax=Daldinia loculata TaxID=103429 RepID=UPI0020C4E1B0|nr:uncharacterized protein F4817DRAFT_355117 [Daldinia loculata]KAI1641670.1 hypothetical protein F4817DRAFT_355117 [Daldinia loculata]KAI2782362.1 hypothetical protein F4815DRAFT_462911 [Daldinia loculata]